MLAVHILLAIRNQLFYYRNTACVADMLLLNCILAYLAALFSDQQEFAGIRHPMPSSGKRPQYVVHMKAINARRESETWVTELPCSLLTFVFDKTQEQWFLDPLTSWLSNFYYISLDWANCPEIYFNYEISLRDNQKEGQNKKMDIGHIQVSLS